MGFHSRDGSDECGRELLSWLTRTVAPFRPASYTVIRVFWLKQIAKIPPGCGLDPARRKGYTLVLKFAGPAPWFPDAIGAKLPVASPNRLVESEEAAFCEGKAFLVPRVPQETEFDSAGLEPEL